MKTIGLFEAKTNLSRICREVAANRETVIVTSRGAPLVRIVPVERPSSVRERRAAYLARHGAEEADEAEDFAPPPRAKDPPRFELADGS